MSIVENKIIVKDLVTKSNLPASDYVINPYVGCPHGCRYCYACFMKRFTGHSEEWGSFIDIKQCDKPISQKKLQGKSVFLSSVTDCYNPFEEKYKITRNILEQLISIDCELNISTKSNLVLRDIDLLKQCKNLKVSISVNTLDEKFQKDMDNASKIIERLKALKILHEEGIYTVLFMSPIFPFITEWKEIIESSKDYIDEYWFENLNPIIQALIATTFTWGITALGALVVCFFKQENKKVILVLNKIDKINKEDLFQKILELKEFHSNCLFIQQIEKYHEP